MTQNSVIFVDISSTDHSTPLGLEIWLDDSLVHDVVPTQEPVQFSVEVDDSQEAEHELKFVLKNKTNDHTQIDEQGNIVKDVVVNVNNVNFDGIELGQIVNDLATYTHDFNGTGATTVEKFYGTMGCNGTVSLKFTTPMYLWLLENM
jgi:hypothetical protein